MDSSRCSAISRITSSRGTCSPRRGNGPRCAGTSDIASQRAGVHAGRERPPPGLNSRSGRVTRSSVRQRGSPSIMVVVNEPTSSSARASRWRDVLAAALDRLAALRPRLLFLVALALHVWALAVRDVPEVLTENLRAGFTLIEKGYLGDPFIEPTGPTGHLSPGYPAVVAAAYSVTGSRQGARVLLSLLCAVVASYATALLVPLARALRLPPGSGALSALAWAVPVFAMLELSAEHETVFSTAIVLLALVTVARRVMAPELHARDGVVLGAITGVGVHFTPLVLPMMLLATAGGVLARRPRPRMRASFVGAFAAALVLVVTPYTARNWSVMGAPFFIR